MLPPDTLGMWTKQEPRDSELVSGYFQGSWVPPELGWGRGEAERGGGLVLSWRFSGE